MARTKLDIVDRFGGQMPTGVPHGDTDPKAKIIAVPVVAKDGVPSHPEPTPATADEAKDADDEEKHEAAPKA